MTAPPKPTARSSFPTAPAFTLLALSAAASLLAVFQWRELLVVRAGGAAVCAMGETVNCEAVWNLPFASTLHALFKMPVAALGLVWGLTAFALSVAYAYGKRRGHSVAGRVLALCGTAGVGLVACAALAYVSFSSGVVCLTCLGTYALVAGFAATVFLALPDRPGRLDLDTWVRAGAWGGGFAVLAYLMLLVPGMATPAQAKSETSSGLKEATEAAHGDVGAYLASLPWAAQQAVSDSLAHYRASSVPDTSRFPPRHVDGPQAAPVRIVEFTDMLCSHCRTLQGVLKDLQRAVPPESLSIEARQFPLDSECNPFVPLTDGRKVRCLAAKLQICLEGAPDFHDLRDQLFHQQRSLHSPERLWAIVTAGKTPRDVLERCVASPQTAQKLQDDIAYAWLYQPQGTPLVLLNGREGTPVSAFLYAMVMTKGNPDAPAFSRLPPPTETATR